MCNLYSITTNQAAIAALFRQMNRYVGNLEPMPGVPPDYTARVIRNAGDAREMILMRWGMPPPRTGVPPIANIRNASWCHSTALPIQHGRRLVARRLGRYRRRAAAALRRARRGAGLASVWSVMIPA
jgi:putative SOS response-associated peptidase YedK